MRTCSRCGEKYKETESVCPLCWQPYHAEEISLEPDSHGRMNLVMNRNPAQRTGDEHKPKIRLSYAECSSGGESGYAVTGCLDSSPISIVIPDCYRDKPVLKIAARAFRAKKTIRLVCLPAKLREIGDSAFEDCISLHSVSGGEELMYIGEAAFRRCILLQQVEALGKREIGCPYSAFAGCYHLPLYPKNK